MAPSLKESDADRAAALTIWNVILTFISAGVSASLAN
jgi:hypothetical protein